MKSLAPLLTLVLCAVWSTGANSINWHTTPDKWESSRLFHTPFISRYNDRIVLGEQKKALPIEGRVYSPNNGYWFYLTEPNTLVPGP